jgi:phosphoribosylformimino-5-aminoimidazole carboxamide ribotide isomerase
MADFTIYPAIDLRQGKVVRLKQGDPERQTIYDLDPPAVAERWLSTRARWLHVVNLDGAFGEPDALNALALASILEVAAHYEAQVQFGGGLRSLAAIQQALEMGVTRTVLGTIVVEQPEIFEQALQRFGPERIVAGLDARDGLVQVRGWMESTALPTLELAQHLAKQGLSWMVFTDVARDGIGTGLNLSATVELAQATGLHVIASGGVSSLEDIEQTRAAGLAGVIVGRALYEGQLTITSWE